LINEPIFQKGHRQHQDNNAGINAKLKPVKRTHPYEKAKHPNNQKRTHPYAKAKHPNNQPDDTFNQMKRLSEPL
jgi:hypothetical protein